MKTSVLLAAILMAALIVSACSLSDAQGSVTILKPDNVRTFERDTVDVWCNQDACRTTSGDTVRLRWRLPRNNSKQYRTYELHYDSRLFKTIVRGPGDRQMTWRDDVFREHKNQRLVLVAGILQQPPWTVLSTVGANATLSLPRPGDWTIFAWVDECKRIQWPCDAPVTHLNHAW